MPIYEWKRQIYSRSPFIADGEWEYAETTTTDPPPGPGWQRVYSYGVGAVKGAGQSPSRQVSGR